MEGRSHPLWDRSLAVEYFTKSLLEAGTFEYPLLESLSLRYDFRDGGSGGFSSFRNCSRLRKLQATHLYYPDLDLVDTANLTTLELVEYSGPSLNHLLVKCPLLETLIIARFKYTPGHTSIPDSDSTVALLDAAVNNTDYDLSRLSHLDIIIRDLGWTPNVIWSGLHLPALTHLSFQYWMESGEAIRELIELLTRSKCVLQRITVDLPKFEQGRWVEFLDGIAPVMAPDICVVEKW
ncbi:hypothetical protein D9757_012222 [Collybiopsis confluens]|uniref:Uncharacterized protein n=1 Tax=Collybiopsis confluens TaxID=2823264 RepID=A0A8H5GLF3_9AGAR|nr:hypothetical protein D9757_012222 [Collybiopsis confluens]